MAGETVLVVDDHDETRDAYAKILELARYQVLEASHGGEAIRLARQQRPDLILMDLAMPVVDGLEAAESLRQYSDTAGIPIISISGHSASWRQQRLRSFSQGFLEKPCTARQLLDEVRRVLSPASPARAAGD